MIKARTGVPELRGPALACLSAIEKKSAYYFVLYKLYWSNSLARILNSQEIIKERTKETS